MSLSAPVLAGLLLTSLSALAQPERLSIVYSAESALPQVTLDELKQETTRLVAPADYSIHWQNKAETNLGSSFERLVVVAFHGDCAPPETGRSLKAATGSLATTAVSGGKVLPFIQVDCDKTGRMLARLMGNLPASARATFFGRALARVLAHEIYHVLAQTTGHKDQGVSKPCFRADDLIASRFHFDPISLAQMRPLRPVFVTPVEAVDVAEPSAGR